MLVLFAILLPLFLIIGSVVVSTGSWYTHGKHLQTKVDAAAFAGGGSWAFPCAPDIDATIESFARQYVGQHTKADGTPYSATTYNPQVGNVQGDQIHVVLNGPTYYDGDTNPNPSEMSDPSGTVCNSKILDVKGTEQDSPLLWGWLPFSPDIKKKARVEIQEVEGLNGLLPIAVRAPEPVSAAAVFYNETTGNILKTKYFVKSPAIFGIPANLQGWSSYNNEDAGTWANFVPAASTGVLVAVSFRGACNTGLPNPNNNISTSPAPCFEDTGFTTVSQLCNQGSTTQIVNCYYANGTWPSETVRSGLHFIRGYGNPTITNRPPQIERAWLENSSCSTNGYFNAHPNSSCNVKLNVEVDMGSVTEDYPPGGPNTPVQTRIAGNMQVRWGIKRADGSTNGVFCNNCDLLPSNPNSTGTVTFSTTGAGTAPHLPLTANSQGNAIAIEIMVRRSTVVPDPGGCGTNLNGFNQNCRWFHVGTGISSTSVNPITNNNGAATLASPVQRAFRGNSLTSGSVQWMRLTTDPACDGPGNGTPPLIIDNDAATQPNGGQGCFFVDMGLKGGIAKDQDEPAVLFNDGVGSSQMGAVDCDPSISQGQILEDGVIQGCSPWYAPNGFDTVPLCPAANNLFSLPNPGPPWTDWPPLECIKTRPTGSMNQLEKGLNGRFFNDKNNPSCPPDSAAGPVKGRNYWDKDTNLYKGASYADDGPPVTGNNLRNADPRLVTIFIAPTEAFTGSGQNTYPLTGFLSVYITGYGRISGNGSVNIDDPCPGNTPPPDVDTSGGNTGGYAVWGHILKHVVPGAGATPSGRICLPTTSLQPCIAVLVE